MSQQALQPRLCGQKIAGTPTRPHDGAVTKSPVTRSTLFRSKRNRRRVDLAKKTGEFKAAAKHHGPVALKLFVLALAFVLVAVGGNETWKWAHTAHQFALSDVNVSGQSEATDVELVRLAGILLGQNLLAMDVRAMER